MHVRCVIFNSCWLRPLSFVTRILVRSMQLASLITAVALLLLSVRGKFGVEIWAKCLTIPRLRLLATDRLAFFFQDLLQNSDSAYAQEGSSAQGCVSQ